MGNSNTALYLSILLTAFIAISAAGFGYTARHWWCAARTEEVEERRLALALFVHHAPLFFIVAVRLAFTAVSWTHYRDVLTDVTPTQLYTPLVTWFLIALAAMTSVGIARGTFSIGRQSDT